MQPINVLTSTAVPLPLPNIDTDQIIPKQFLKRIERTGYGDFLFYDWRYDLDTPDHVAERRQLVEGAVAGIVMEVGAGQYHRGPPAAGEQIVGRSPHAPPLAVSPA